MKILFNNKTFFKTRSFFDDIWINTRWYTRESIRLLIRFWKWSPVIWKDRDWDQNFLYQIMIFKLKTMEHYFRNTDSALRSKDWREIIRDINNTREALERLCDNSYGKKEWKEHNSRFGELEIDFEPTDNPKLSKAVFTPDSRAAQAFRKKIYGLENKSYKADWELVWSNFKDKSQRWWE